jgi:membrane protein
MGRATRPAGGQLAALCGLAILAVGALTVFLHIRNCLRVIWRLAPPGGGGGLVVTVLNYFLAVAMVLCVGGLLLLSLAVSTGLPFMIEWMSEELPCSGVYLQWLDAAVTFLILTVFLALVYRIMSGRRIAWGYVLYGAGITALLFAAGKTLIGLFLAYTSTVSAYGAAGSLVAFLIWVYYSSQIFFFGAELIQARRTRAEWMGGGTGEVTRA